MSQSGILRITTGVLPPTVPTSFVTDNGTVIPAANIVNINGGSTSANFTPGIQIIANPNGSNNEVVELTNRIQGTATTTDGVSTVQVYSFPLGAVPGVYQFTTNVVSYDVTDAIGAGYTSTRTVRTTGAAGVLIDAFIVSIGEEGAMTGILVQNSISGNNLILSVVGLAGKTIDYNALTTYIFVS